ncbi:hypothetical protein OHB53_40940 [Streptomyces sp. NBC_00056]|nr:hypothetical protein [Streptomyces sp. NBC_00063]MCX5435250.1 hypothetical protein [Streptomyces sp. NBC_00063]
MFTLVRSRVRTAALALAAVGALAFGATATTGAAAAPTPAPAKQGLQQTRGSSERAGHQVPMDTERHVDVLVSHPLGNIRDGNPAVQAVGREEVAQRVRIELAGDARALLRGIPLVVEAV